MAQPRPLPSTALPKPIWATSPERRQSPEATITIRGPARISATGRNTATAISDGGGGGGISITALLLTATVGTDEAYVGPATTVTAGSLDVQATDTNTANADSKKVVNVNGVGGTGVNATATISRTVAAFMDRGVDGHRDSTSSKTSQTTRGAVSLEAISNSTADATSEGGTGGGIEVMAMLPTATINGSTKAFVAEGATITAQSLSHTGRDAARNATATASIIDASISAGGSGANAKTEVTGDVEAYVGRQEEASASSDSTNLDLDGHMDIEATSVAYADSEGDVGAGGGISEGEMLTGATIRGNTRAYIGDDTVISRAGTIQVKATSINTAATDSHIGSGALVCDRGGTERKPR